MKKKFLLGLIAAIVIFVSLGYFGLKLMMKSVGMGGQPTADYSRRIEIWNTVAGNSQKSKLADMNIPSKKANFELSTYRFLKGIVGDQYKDREQDVDTFTYLYEIKHGYEKETYEDQPYLVPYQVKHSKGAVIVVPGGGFGYKSIDGSTTEGKDIALKLNQAGYSAFVLHYRSNPYEYPIPQLDLQRAVRYLRYHAEELSISANKISAVGFSAGGNLIGSYINLTMGHDQLPKHYTKDAVDQVDDNVKAPAMIYPALSFNNNIPMLFAMFDDQEVKNLTKREQLLTMMDLKRHLNTNVTEQFISYGTKDQMVGMAESRKYIAVAREQGIQVKSVSVKDGQHGFPFKKYGKQYLTWLDQNLR